MKPDLSPVPEYFRTYTDLVTEEYILDALNAQTPDDLAFFRTVSEEQANKSYAPGKWTVKEVLQHIIDSERVFCYRAMALARGEQATLPGFDQDEYIRYAHANARTWEDLVKAYEALRTATIHFAGSLTGDDLGMTGNVSDYQISVRAILFIIVGHVQHHINILTERYL